MAIYLPPISPLCPHIECLLYAKHSVGYFIYNSHSCMSRGIIFIFRKGNRSTEKSSTRSTVTQLGKCLGQNLALDLSCSCAPSTEAHQSPSKIECGIVIDRRVALASFGPLFDLLCKLRG